MSENLTTPVPGTHIARVAAASRREVRGLLDGVPSVSPKSVSPKRSRDMSSLCDEVLSTDELLGVILGILLREDALRRCKCARLVCKRWKDELARAAKTPPRGWKSFTKNCVYLRGRVESLPDEAEADPGSRWMRAIYEQGLNGLLDSRLPHVHASCAALVAHHKAMRLRGLYVVLAPAAAHQRWLAAFARDGISAFANGGRPEQRYAGFASLGHRLAQGQSIEVVVSTYSMAATDIWFILQFRPKYVFFEGGLCQPKQYASRLAPLLLASPHLAEPPNGVLIDDASLLQHHSRSMELIRFSMDRFIKIWQQEEERRGRRERGAARTQPPSRTRWPRRRRTRSKPWPPRRRGRPCLTRRRSSALERSCRSCRAAAFRAS